MEKLISILIGPQIYIEVIADLLTAVFVFISYGLGAFWAERYKPIWKAYALIILGCGVVSFCSSGIQYSTYINDVYVPPATSFSGEGIITEVRLTMFLVFIILGILGIYLKNRDRKYWDGVHKEEVNNENTKTS